MANTITISLGFDLSGENVLARAPADLVITQTNALLYDAVISCTTSDTALAFGSISGATLGYLMIENMDDTNYVQVGPDSGGSIVPMIRVGPGEFVMIRCVPSITLRVQANTSTCKVRFTMYAF